MLGVLIRAMALALVLTTTMFAAATPAWAQEEGVTLDPGDPAAKEYALPHEQARREAGSDPTAPVEPGRRDSALFGEGVQPDGGGRPSAEGDDAGAAASSQTESSAASGSASDDAGSPAPETSTAGVSSTAALLGGGAGVLLLALLGGAGLRAVRGPRDT
jgi:hypothetical protein